MQEKKRKGVTRFNEPLTGEYRKVWAEGGAFTRAQTVGAGKQHVQSRMGPSQQACPLLIHLHLSTGQLIVMTHVPEGDG